MAFGLSKLNLPDRSRLRSLAAMYALHGLNLALPLVTLPIITRALGPSEYGRYGVLINWAGIGVILIEFGMGVAATKQLTGRDDHEARVTQSRVLVQQSLNALVVLPLLALATLFWMHPAPELAASVLMLANAWSLGLNTLWFRVARANVPRLLPATFAAKFLSLLIVVVLLPRRPTLEVAMWANLASGFWPVFDAWFARRELLEAAREFSLRAWIERLKVSYPVPLQRIGSAIYLLLPATLVAVFFSPKVAGWYVLSDRIIRAGTGLFQPLTSTLFPLQLEVRGQPPGSPSRLRLRRYLTATIGVSALASAFTFFLAGPAVRLIGGDKFADAALFLRWMAPLVALITVNMALTNQLYVIDREPVIAQAVWVSGLTFAGAIFFLGRLSPDLFAACCLMVEALVCIWLLIAWRVYRNRESVAPPPGYPPRPESDPGRTPE
ncbi:MAG TPA: lipopolysaccharide biosynthesis protein [Polyangiales bacterium]|nr:lipopolysaccharide biosynthesis protein [Polyangiales bacterium]